MIYRSTFFRALDIERDVVPDDGADEVVDVVFAFRRERLNTVGVLVTRVGVVSECDRLGPGPDKSGNRIVQSQIGADKRNHRILRIGQTRFC